jgi:hypothetical protein
MTGQILHPGETLMGDDDMLFHDMTYLVNGRVTRLNTYGRCGVVKRELGVRDIRWCNTRRRCR